jgi:hypothetical protein
MYWYFRTPFSSYAAYCFAKERVGRDLLTNGQYRVLNGPYKGMLYTRHGSSLNLNCLLGTYEMEIWTVIESVQAGRYDLILDVGCAEGYHACGLAKKSGIDVIAYDNMVSARQDCAEMVRLNGLEDRVTIKAYLTHEEMEIHCAGKRVFVFCDIDYAEKELLDPVRVPSLRHTDILVETHGLRQESDENTLPIILNRFNQTHEATVFSMQPRFPHLMWDFVEKGTNHHFAIGKVRDEPLCQGFFEARGCNSWVWLKSKPD